MKKLYLLPLIATLPLLTAGCNSNNKFANLFKPKSQQIAEQAGNETKQTQTAQSASAQSQQTAAARQTGTISTSQQQYLQGYNLFYGIGAQHNETRGIQLLEQAAEQGHPQAKSLLQRLAGMGYKINDNVLAQAQTAGNPSTGYSTESIASVASVSSGASAASAYNTYESEPEVIKSQDWYYSEQAAQSNATPQLSTDLTTSVATQTQNNYQVSKQPIATESSLGAVTAKSNKSGLYTRDEQALLGMNGGLYTLQLVAANDKAGVDQFIQENQLQNDVRVVKKQSGGRDWYVALYGSYKDRAAAQSAARQLQSQLTQSTSPWIRPISNIQDELNTRG